MAATVETGFVATIMRKWAHAQQRTCPLCKSPAIDASGYCSLEHEVEWRDLIAR